MCVHVKKWGNSAAVRIPAPVLAAADQQIDQAVDVLCCPMTSRIMGYVFEVVVIPMSADPDSR